MENRNFPSRENALGNRHQIYDRLAGSLDHLVEAIDCDRDSKWEIAFRSHAKTLRSGVQIRPDFFSHYFELIQALQGNDTRKLALKLKHIASQQDIEAKQPLQIRPFNRQNFSAAEEGRLRKDFASESLLSRQIVKLSDKELNDSLDQLNKAIDLLRTHAPNSYAELSVMIAEIVPVRGFAGNGFTFDGCSSVERWGSILLNARIDKSTLELAETLVHEASHSVLFAMAPDDQRIKNDYEMVYPSPLRVDPRPLDGIYHAVFVLSRMHFAMQEVLSSSAADADLRQEAKSLSQLSRQGFEEGYDVLKEHAIYTPRGREIMESSVKVMRSS